MTSRGRRFGTGAVVVMAGLTPGLRKIPGATGKIGAAPYPRTGAWYGSAGTSGLEFRLSRTSLLTIKPPAPEPTIGTPPIITVC